MTLGRLKLFERISPKKTWEGALGGMIASLAFAYFYADYLEHFNLLQTMIFALLIIVFGTFGDLIESMFKRNFNVKDSSNLLPGHGGVLDRIDSILLAAPITYAYIEIFF